MQRFFRLKMDPEGRYVILTIQIASVTFTLVTVYVPPPFPADVLVKLSLMLLSRPPGPLLYEIKGLPIATIEEQISLYADDTLVYLADTQDLLKTLLLEIDKFGDYSGFRVNWDKSNLFPLDPDATVQIHPDSRIQVVSSFRYLVVIVQLPLSTYIENNLCPLLIQLLA